MQLQIPGTPVYAPDGTLSSDPKTAEQVAALTKGTTDAYAAEVEYRRTHDDGDEPLSTSDAPRDWWGRFLTQCGVLIDAPDAMLMDSTLNDPAFQQLRRGEGAFRVLFILGPSDPTTGKAGVKQNVPCQPSTVRSEAKRAAFVDPDPSTYLLPPATPVIAQPPAVDPPAENAHPLDSAPAGTTITMPGDGTSVTMTPEGHHEAPASTVPPSDVLSRIASTPTIATKEATGQVSLLVPPTAHNSAFRVFGDDVKAAVAKFEHWFAGVFHRA